MIQAQDADIERLVEISREYTGLLARMENTTSHLVESFLNSETDKLDGILQARESLCGEIGRMSSDFNRQLKILAARMDTLGYPSASCSGLHQALAQVEGLRSSILRQQTECENIFAGKLGEVKSELTTLRQQKGIRNAYKPAHIQNARFLDNKL